MSLEQKYWFPAAPSAVSVGHRFARWRTQFTFFSESNFHTPKSSEAIVENRYGNLYKDTGYSTKYYQLSKNSAEICMDFYLKWMISSLISLYLAEFNCKRTFFARVWRILIDDDCDCDKLADMTELTHVFTNLFTEEYLLLNAK